MKRIILICAAAAMLAAGAIYALGDIARPKPTPAQPKTIFYTGLTVTTDPKSYEARLQISEETLKRLQAAAVNKEGTPSLVQNTMHSSTRTIMAGLFMF